MDPILIQRRQPKVKEKILKRRCHKKNFTNFKKIVSTKEGTANLANVKG